MYVVFVTVFEEKDETKKAELKKALQTETLPAALKQLETMLAKNGGKFFVGKDVRHSNEMCNTFTTNALYICS